jgi:hypothetical protein
MDDTEVSRATHRMSRTGTLRQRQFLEFASAFGVLRKHEDRRTRPPVEDDPQETLATRPRLHGCKIVLPPPD